MTFPARPDTPFITVVIPSHRRAELLRAALASALDQDYPTDAYEVIVAHNVTPDETEAQVRALAATTPVAVTYLPQQNPGPAMSRHNGAMAGRGALIAFLDDDCQATPGWLAAGAAAWAAGADLVQGRTLPNPAQPRHFFEKTVQVEAESPYFETCNIFYDRTAFEAVNGFHGPFEALFWGEDTDLGWRVKAAGHKTAFAPDALVHHEVFDLAPMAWLREALFLRNVPLLVKTWPQMRGAMYLGYFVHRQSATFALALLGSVLALLLGWPALILWLPYVAVRFIEGGRYRNPVLLAARLVLGLPRAFLTTATLAWGSLRHRVFLL